MLKKLKRWAHSLKTELLALRYAIKDRRTPWHAKLLIALIIGYALSPIDLIPDFIPILGFVDDMVLLPLGIYIVLKLIPTQVMQESRQKAVEAPPEEKTNWLAACIFVLVWLMLAWAVYRLVAKRIGP